MLNVTLFCQAVNGGALYQNLCPCADFFFDELMPCIYANLPASTRPEDNYLAGCSMGGAAALMYGLYRPDAFARAAVLGSSVREFRGYAESLGVTNIQYEIIPGYGHDREDIPVRRVLELMGLIPGGGALWNSGTASFSLQKESYQEYEISAPPP